MTDRRLGSGDRRNELQHEGHGPLEGEKECHLETIGGNQSGIDFSVIECVL
jgi:hypothetical protein